MCRITLHGMVVFYKFQTVKVDIFRITYQHMFENRTYHLTMVIVGGWRSLFQSLAQTLISLSPKFQVPTYGSF